MKTSEEIAARILENIEHMIVFPKMWFGTPESMEEWLFYLTDLLSFIHEQSECQYGDYLVSKGYQSNTFTNRIKENGHSDANETFSLFSAFFKEFFDAFKLTLNK